MDNENIAKAILIFLAIDTIAVICLFAFRISEKAKRRKISHFGDMAEEKVSAYITSCFPGSTLFNNILIKTEKGLTEIDHLLICRWGVFVIETKSHNGKIVIGEKDWVQYYGNKVIKFHSPLLQNAIHIKAVESLLKGTKFSKTKVSGLVVFTSDKVFFTQRVKGVIKLDRLNSAIKSGKTSGRYQHITSPIHRKYLSKDAIREISAIVRKNIDTNERHKKDHDEKINLLSHSYYSRKS